MIWLSYPLLLGILVCIFISLLAILSVFKQTMLRLKISIVLAAVIILFVVFFQDNYITDAYRQEWKLVKVLEIAMSVLLVVAGVAGHLKGKQSSQPTESSNVDNLLSHGELPITEEAEENVNREDAEGNGGHGTKTNQVEFDPQWKEKIFTILKHKLVKLTDEEVDLILNSLDYYLINPTDDEHLPKEKIPLGLKLYTQKELQNAFGVLLYLPLTRDDCARFMKNMFSIYDKTEESTITSKISGNKVWSKEKIEELWKEIHPES